VSNYPKNQSRKRPDIQEKPVCACVTGVNQQYLVVRFRSNTTEPQKFLNLIWLANTASH